MEPAQSIIISVRPILVHSHIHSHSLQGNKLSRASYRPPGNQQCSCYTLITTCQANNTTHTMSNTLPIALVACCRLDALCH